MSPVLLPSLLGAAAVACLGLVPRASQVRLHDLVGDVARGHQSHRAVRLSAARALSPVLVLPLVAALAWGPVAGLLGTAAAALLVRWRRARSVAAARAQERVRAVEACAALAGELRAGRSVPEALDAAADVAVGPSRTSFAAAAAAAQIGGDVAAALRPPDACAVGPVLDALAACWSVCSTSGSGLASAVERLEEGLRAEQAQRRAVDAELAGPRATAGLLALLPVAGLLLASGLGAHPLHVLLHTPVGVVCLVGGLGLDAFGVWWTGRLVVRAGGTG